MQCVALHSIYLTAVFQYTPSEVRSPTMTRSTSESGYPLSARIQQIELADMVAPAGIRARHLWGAGLCTTEHCSSPEGVWEANEYCARGTAQLPTLAVRTTLRFQAIAKSGWADIGSPVIRTSCRQ